MSVCKYNISEVCREQNDCAVCILEKVKNEIENKIDKRYVAGSSAIYESCIEIIDKQIKLMS